MKIQIIGYSGSGKSTLATELGNMLNLPVLHLDSTHFYGDWQERTTDEQSQIVRTFMEQNDSWIMDGNWRKVVPERYAMTDITVLMMLNRWTCFWRAFRRYRKYRNEPRPDLGCAEKFDASFRRWILWGGRTKARRNSLYEKLNATAGQKVVLKTRRQVKKFLQKMRQQCTN